MTTTLGLRPAHGSRLTAAAPERPDRATDACWLSGTAYGPLKRDIKFGNRWLCLKCTALNPDTWDADVRAGYALIGVLALPQIWTSRAYIPVAIQVARDHNTKHTFGEDDRAPIKAWHDLPDEWRDRADGRPFSWLNRDGITAARQALTRAAVQRFGKDGAHLR